MRRKSPSQLKILNDTLDLMTLMTHAKKCTAEPTLLCTFSVLFLVGNRLFRIFAVKTGN